MKHYIKNKYWQLTEDCNIDKILYLLIDRPDYIEREYNYSCFWWLNNNKYHRDYDLPAKVWEYGFYSWYYKGKRHRDNNKPATTYFDGYQSYWVNNEFIKSENL